MPMPHRLENMQVVPYVYPTAADVVVYNKKLQVPSPFRSLESSCLLAHRHQQTPHQNGLNFFEH